MVYYTFGESLLDIIVDTKGQTQTIPGGSQLNVASNLAMAGHKVQHISFIGDDSPGRIINDFLNKSGIKIDFLQKDPQHKTTLAFATLDEKGQASYSFYKDYPERLFTDSVLPEFTSESCFSFGSMAALKERWQPALDQLLKAAKNAGSFIFYDPNIRTKLKDTPTEKRLIRNMQSATIIRGSDEDFISIFGTADPVVIAEKAELQEHQLLLITQGAGDVITYFMKEKSFFPLPSLKPVSTIGAGDAFNAGILSFVEVMQLKANKMHLLSQEIISVIVGVGVSFSADVCQSYSNTISAEMAERLSVVRAGFP